ncbi:MAG: adenosylcobinamide-GDP ribazoletransferase [Candidatus Omnitrophica bacterium]|nr:adenosylcobinamide-GDP ribazoletransferase [Candidatus Omnitrophota bacterium]MBU4488379.1 adenosylcobinamide-GDP ribazoletransferase [Candidatus Omnitrophota bacterium]MCG2705014.1 adenosylcobinamide-GDP ribazoletransferase [Candidatus Omnitrophota bacterium]
MRSFLVALQFLTLLPVKGGKLEEGKLKRAIVFFPLVGLLIGLFLVAANQLFSFLNLGQLCVNTIIVAFLIFVTGGLHLDGLGDTFDGIAGGKGRDEILRIMRDPHIGTMGALSIVIAVILGIALLSEIGIDIKAKALLLMCVLSRWAMVFAMFSFPYARKEGKALLFFKNTDVKNFTFASFITLFIAIALWHLKGFLIFAIVALSAYITGKSINTRIDGITGDTLGAINEIAQIITLIFFAIQEWA